MERVSAEEEPSGIDWYFTKHEKWESSLRALRALLLEAALTEELKWGCPCYTRDGAKIALLHVFKEYCALLFFKGALLKDSEGVLVQQTKNVQAARQIRFTGVHDVEQLEHVVRAYLREALAVEKSGLHIVRKTTAQFVMADEFAERLQDLPAFRQAFYALTPGRQHAYLLYFSSAKQSKTRAARVAKCLQRILDGQGLHDG
jgi:uncharacterized protein YdeI (YjbR/CyaY-like superfamily)